MKHKIIVIMGEAGFISSNLCYSLCSNNNIIVIDDLFTGNLENIKDLINEGHIGN